MNGSSFRFLKGINQQNQLASLLGVILVILIIGVASILGLGGLFASGQECIVSDTLHNIADLRRTEKMMFLGSKTVVTQESVCCQ